MQNLTLLTAIVVFAVKTVEVLIIFGSFQLSYFGVASHYNQFLDNSICTTKQRHAIDCFQCNSSSNMECSDSLMNLNGGILEATSCDHVYNAQYCIKQTGRISTKRYCSSLDLGGFCNYVQQPGDKLEYRTCIYTCSTDGCNGTSSIKISIISLILGLFTFQFVGF